MKALQRYQQIQVKELDSPHNVKFLFLFDRSTFALAHGTTACGAV